MSDLNMTPTHSTLDSSSTASGVVSPVAQEEEGPRGIVTTTSTRHHPIEDFIKHVSETQVVEKAYVYAASVPSPKLVQTVAEKLSPYITLAQPMLASVVHSIDSRLDSTYNIVDDCVARSQQLKSTTIVRVGRVRVVVDSIMVLTNDAMHSAVAVVCDPRTALAFFREKTQAAVADVRKRSASLSDDISQFSQDSLLVNMVMKSKVFVFIQQQLPSPINLFTNMANMSKQRASIMYEHVVIRGKNLQIAIQGMIAEAMESPIGKTLMNRTAQYGGSIVNYLNGLASNLTSLRAGLVRQLFNGMRWSCSKVPEERQAFIMEQFMWMGKKICEMIGPDRSASFMSTFFNTGNLPTEVSDNIPVTRDNIVVT